jgi:aspartate/methionine/tyrosine aminotransferase
MVSQRLAPFGTTIFAETTALAIKHGAINLAQGFPDFDGPDFIKEAAVRAIQDGHNQYARTYGIPPLIEAIAETFKSSSGLTVHPDSQVTVTSGCTEALPAVFLGLINPGDEVILFEPFYDSYRACVELSGAVPRFVTLFPGPDGEFIYDENELRRAFAPFNGKFPRAILVNTPHNPTGKVFSRAELSVIARLCVEHDVIAIVDEVYEKLTFDPKLPHLHLASFPGMADRTVTLSSLGKTFSLTGWKIGWAIASPELTKGIRAAHQFLTFATATPLQHGAVAALRNGSNYIAELVESYTASRAFLASALQDAGFTVFKPSGTYFIMADISNLLIRLRNKDLQDDVTFCKWLTTELKVAAIPPSVFYQNKVQGSRLVRFAFCKKQETLQLAQERLQVLGKM